MSIENLANATGADRESIATLTTIIGKLTVDLAEANVRLAKALADNAELATKLATRKNNTTDKMLHTHTIAGPMAPPAPTPAKSAPADQKGIKRKP